MLPELSLALVLSLTIFVLHLVGYTIYAINTLKESIRPNAASWSMWFFGGLVEYLTYSAIDSDSWLSSSLPLACVIGLVMILMATLYTQWRASKVSHGEKIIFHKPKPIDYILMSFDTSAGLIWLIFSMPALANIIAVSSSIVTFIPIWRTTLATGEEKPLPWIFWCLAYFGMTIVVLLEGGDAMAEKLFYPLYYLFLHSVVLMLCYSSIRRYIQRARK